MIQAGDDLDPIPAAGMAAILQRKTASTAQANRWLFFATTEGHSTALPPVTSDITEMAMAHWSPFELRELARVIDCHYRQFRHPCKIEL
jgi:hypothetical protein